MEKYIWKRTKRISASSKKWWKKTGNDVRCSFWLQSWIFWCYPCWKICFCRSNFCITCRYILCWQNCKNLFECWTSLLKSSLDEIDFDSRKQFFWIGYWYTFSNFAKKVGHYVLVVFYGPGVFSCGLRSNLTMRIRGLVLTVYLFSYLPQL